MNKIISVRRKLFSSIKRRSLFCTDQIEACPVNDTNKPQEILICQDCGYEMSSLGNTTDVVCPNCGGRRFNYLKKMEGHQLGVGPDSNTSMGKVFSKISRRSLFSDLTNIGAQDGTGELDRNPQELNVFRCTDCGHVFEDISNTSAGLHCPNCGGSRVVLEEGTTSAEDEKEFSEIDEFLKEYSGKAVETSELQKLFSERGISESIDSVLDSGYATENNEGQICFSENSDAIRKLFSKLVISITKELDLPEPTCKESMINSLEGRLPEKGLMIIRKVHGLLPPGEEIHLEKSPESSEDYLHDSGIVGDLKLEHGGSSMPLRDFMTFLDTRYNDAPENIVDLLCNRGVVKISGANVDII